MGATGKAIVPPIVILLVSLFAAAVTYSAILQAKMHDVATVARMPIPGAKDVTLENRRYGLYFGLLNAPSRKMMHIPKLKIALVPPAGKPDPEFVEVDGSGDDTMVDGFTTVRVANINVTAPGLYHVKVESPDEAGGSFSIGEPQTPGDEKRALFFAGITAAVGLVTSVLLLAQRLRARAA